jgi:hypothetical protein
MQQGGDYNPKYIPKEFRDPISASVPYYFLAFEKDNPGLFDESNDTYYMTKRQKVKGKMESTRVLKVWTPLVLVVRDKKNVKTTILGQLMKGYPKQGVAEVKYSGKVSAAKGRKSVKNPKAKAKGKRATRRH